MAAKTDRTPPLLRAFALLERVAQADAPMTLRDAAQASALPKPTVYRMLAMLEAAGLLVRESDGRVSPGPRLARFSLPFGDRCTGRLDLGCSSPATPCGTRRTKRSFFIRQPM